MAVISFTIPDNQAGRLSNAQVLDNFCTYHGYTGFKPSGGAETKLEFLKRKTIEYWYYPSDQVQRVANQTAFTPTSMPDVT
jgi:hypothetical protein